MPGNTPPAWRRFSLATPNACKARRGAPPTRRTSNLRERFRRIWTLARLTESTSLTNTDEDHGGFERDSGCCSKSFAALPRLGGSPPPCPCRRIRGGPAKPCYYHLS